MNRNEYLAKLEEQLADISFEEKEEALQYYRNYFEDAGVEHEMDVIRELGSPERIAATIKADLKDNNGADAGEFTEQGYRDARFDKKETPAQKGTMGSGEENTSQWMGQDPTSEHARTSKGGMILLIALIALIVAPIIIPIVFGLGAAVIGIVIAVFAFFAGLVIGAAAIMFAGFVIVVVGIPLLVVALPAGLLAIGSGLLTFVIGLIATVATVKLCIVMYPAIFRIMVNICRAPFYRRKAIG